MTSVVMPRLERRSLLTGAAVTLALAVPPAVIGTLLSDDDLAGSNWVPVLFFWIVLAFLAGGYVAARRQPHAPQAHGGVAALLAYAVVQGVGVVRHLLADESISWLAIVFSALLATSVGTVGGMIAHGRRVRASESP